MAISNGSAQSPPGNSSRSDSLTGTSPHGAVVGSYSIVDFELGIHGGGPLFADGTVGGNVAVNLSAFGSESGDLIFQLRPTTWYYDDFIPGLNSEGIILNYQVEAVKGTPPPIGYPPGTFSDFAPITGTPTRIDIPPANTVGHPDLLIRVTLNPNFEATLG